MDSIDDGKTPNLLAGIDKSKIQSDRSIEENDKKKILELIEKCQSGRLGQYYESTTCYSHNRLLNLHLSKCYHCQDFSVWLYDRLLYPGIKSGITPNIDLPPDILRDFEEARETVEGSPRGAAALLRLCVQKLCAFLGEKGKRIDDDIAALVGKGLDPLVQQSLDIVRVVGNEAVHPGTLDIKDDRDTALMLFDLVNAIADQLISHPKKVKALYEKLPEDKRQAIVRRDGKA